uniref:Wax synthase domain-containing protein n=1 Tax=Leersia perrieri TaxID=77586 RepID=A0A0D9VFN2_9ORYZ
MAAAALMDSELGSLAKASAAVWAASSYARLAASRLRPGAPRLAALLPVVALFCAIPFSFSTATFRGCSGFLLSWLGVFKLLLLAAGQGPLDPTLPLHHFVFSASLPVKLRRFATAAKGKDVADPALCPPGNDSAAGKILVSGAVIPVIIYTYQFKSAMSQYQLLVLYTGHIYFSLQLLLASVHAVVHGALGMEMEPQVDRPYLASSLQDFWGRRWNLMVPAILRPSVYRPVRSRLGVAAGVLVAFLVSGIMHEVMFFYIMWRPPSGEVTAFFLLHGACTAAEAWWARHAGWWRPPRAAAVPLTLAFVAGTACWLFFPAMIKGGLDDMVLRECQGMVAVMEQSGRWFAGVTNLSLTFAATREGIAVITVPVAVAASMHYARLVATHIRPGFGRLLALTPVLALLVKLPLTIPLYSARGIAAFFLVWLAEFKLLLLASGRGPLDPSLPPLPFVFCAALPVKLIRERPSSDDSVVVANGNAKRASLSLLPVVSLAIKFAIMAEAVIYLIRRKNEMHRYAAFALYAVVTYCFLDSLLPCVAAAVSGALGMELEPQFDRPYLSSSLGDFWGRRWNLAASASLRASVYEPVRASSGSPAAGVLGAHARGGRILHHVPGAAHGQVTAFFAQHGACVFGDLALLPRDLWGRDG